MQPEPAFGHSLRPWWRLDPAIRFLNHGSFGATPIPVLEAQDDWRRRCEGEPVRFMLDELPGALRAAATALAGRIGARPADLAFCTNATEAINAVLASLAWRPGNAVVIANHAYPAIRHSVAHVAARHGLRIAEAAVPFPLAGEDAIVAAYAAAIGPGTRLVIVDHVFSPLAVVAPVARLVALCRERGAAVLVDAAHAPGMLALDLDRRGADWTVGNAHKWMFAARGCAFLHAAPAAAVGLHPAVISNHYGSGFPDEFDWIGTRDYSAWTSLPAALAFIDGLGAERYRQHLASLAGHAAARLAAAWGVGLPAPTTMFAGMVTLPLPLSGGFDAEQARRLRRHLLEAYAIEVPVLCIDGRPWVRISAQVYNEIGDYDALADAILDLRGRR